MRYLLLILFLSSFYLAHTQDSYTDGLAYYDYVDDELFLVFKKKYWEERKRENSFSIKRAIKESVLFVRLEGHEEQIASLNRIGKNSAADKILERDKERNKSIIEGLRDHNPGGVYYFYYPKHARDIFVEKDFSKLLTPEMSPAKNVKVDEFAFALLNDHIHLWDVKGLSMGKISRRRTHPIFNRRFSSLNYAGMERFFTKMK